MKRFDFRFQNVLKWRALQLELSEEQLQKLFHEMRALEAQQASFAAAQSEAERAVLEAPSVAAQDLAALDGHRRWVKTQQRRLARQIRDCDARITTQREQVRKAEQDLKLMEKLRDRRLSEWTATADKQHQTLAEESFLAKWQRQAQAAATAPGPASGK